MHALAIAYRILGGFVVAAFCICHLGSLLEWNLRYPLGDKRFEDVLGVESSKKLHEYTGKWCRGAACEQHWNMFSNVGSSSDVLLIVIVRKNRTRVLLHSDLEPAFVNLPAGADYLAPNLSDEERELAWRFNFGNGRMRKLEDNVLSGTPGFSFARYSYMRWRIRAYLEDSGENPDDFLRMDLFRLQVLHPNFDGPARLGGATWVMQYEPRLDMHWPKP